MFDKGFVIIFKDFLSSKLCFKIKFKNKKASPEQVAELPRTPYVLTNRSCIFYLVFVWESYNYYKNKTMMSDYEESQLFSVLSLGDNLEYESIAMYTQTSLHSDVDDYLDMRNGIKDHIEELAGTDDTQDNESQSENDQEEFLEKNSQETENSSTFFYGQVTYGEIQFSQEKKRLRDQALNGYNYETQNIGKHFKTSTCSYLTLLMKTQSLDQEETEAANEFFDTNGAIEDFKNLFQVKGLREKCREYYESQTFMRSFLASGKMDIRSKIAMLRHLEKVRQMTFGQSANWKISNF